MQSDAERAAVDEGCLLILALLVSGGCLVFFAYCWQLDRKPLGGEDPRDSPERLISVTSPF